MKQKFKAGFTLIELLTVITIIAVLAGLILNIAGFVQKKGAKTRAQNEIKAIETACESYKADNGNYPIDFDGFTAGTFANALITATSSLSSLTCYDPTSINYQKSCAVLYQAITGDGNGLLSGSTSNSKGQMGWAGKCYMELKPSQTGSNGIYYYIQDPFGFCYGYSTVQATSGTNGYNPTFDLWSTAGTTTPASSGTQSKWVINW